MSFVIPEGSKVYVAPYNSLTIGLVQELGREVDFKGYIDSSKTGDGVIQPGHEDDYDYVIIDSPNYWKEISANFARNKVLLHGKMNEKYIELDAYESITNQRISVDVLLFPFNKSNIIDLSIVSRELKLLNVTSALVDLGSNRDSNIKEGILENADVTFIPRDRVPFVDYHCLVTSNDWHPMCNAFFKNERARGIITVGIVDGIEDFEDTDYKTKRYAYETVEHVLLMGSDDQKYFTHKIDKTEIIGLPKLWDIYHSAESFPEKIVVMINLNFTYGYFEDVRDEWLSQVISACETLGFDYVISQHHADNGVIDVHKKSTKNVYDTIKSASIVVSRFSTVILESLASGKPVVYFNPHGEKVKIYKDPRGAYPVATTQEQLVCALRNGVNEKGNIHKIAHDFLEAKCFVSSTCPPGRAAAKYIHSILSKRG